VSDCDGCIFKRSKGVLVENFFGPAQLAHRSPIAALVREHASTSDSRIDADSARRRLGELRDAPSKIEPLHSLARVRTFDVGRVRGLRSFDFAQALIGALFGVVTAELGIAVFRDYAPLIAFVHNPIGADLHCDTDALGSSHEETMREARLSCIVYLVSRYQRISDVTVRE
jgi:hypothetical protein